MLALVAAAAAGEREVVQASDGERSVVLISSDQESYVEDDGRLEKLDLPEGAWVNRIAALENGWVAGGARTVLDGRQDLFMLVSEDGRVEYYDLPPVRMAYLRQSTVPLVEAGQLVGVAWLEGPDLESLTVCAAALDGRDWGGTETVSPATPDGQVALSGVVLDDASWLLVWSRDDGEDSETFWSLRRPKGQWTPPRRAHEDNSVPDITPAVIATNSGALMVWSWFDGDDYRLRLSRFDAGRWREALFLGPPGSHYPTFTKGSGNVRLLFRTVVPSAWTLLEIDASGNLRRRATLGGGSGERPVVSDDGTEVLFRRNVGRSEALERRIAVPWEELR